MKNTVIWGLETDITQKAFKMLEQENYISIKAWFGEKELYNVVTHNCFDLYRDNKFGNQAYQGCDPEIYSYVYKELYTFFDMHSRNFFNQPVFLHDFLNIFNIILDYFYRLLKENDVELVILANLPHEGPEFILYLLAKALNIKTIIVMQSLFPDKFFYLFNWEDFGSFKQVPELSSVTTSVTVKKQYEKDLFYMKDVNKDNSKNLLEAAQKYLRVSDWANKRFKVWENSWRKIRKYNSIKNMLLSRLITRLLRYQADGIYNKNVKKYYLDNVDVTEQFVYFPLHLQPEMTTSSLGGVYCDQLLAIERLSAWLPNDCAIYVKENPKQNSFMRGKYFFERLLRIPKVKLLSPKVNTYDLIRNCQFVSTITGTAGWEAISGGKNVVIFGRAWYKELPGVFSFSSSLDFDNVVKTQINHDELEKTLALLLKKTTQGVVDPIYTDIVENFDCERNNLKIYNFFREVINF